MKSDLSTVLTASLGWVLRLFRKPGRSDVMTLLLMMAIVVSIGVAAVVLMVLTADVAHATPLTSGDRVQVVLENGEGFSGKYQVDVHGQIALPLVDGALVAGNFIATEKDRTVIILKKHRRQHFDRRNGHRQL